MRKVNKEELIKFMVENQDCSIIISSDARIEDSEEYETYSFGNEEDIDTYLQQCIREEWIRFNWNPNDMWSCDADEMDARYYLDDYMEEGFKKANIELV